MKVVKIRSEFESLYSKTVQECVSLIEEESNYEQEQIRVALEIGRKIDQLVTDATESETAIKNLARDIFKARRKIIAPSKLLEYRQLYLIPGKHGNRKDRGGQSSQRCFPGFFG